MTFSSRQALTCLAACVLFALALAPARASAPHLVRDINTTPIGVSSDPQFLGTLGTWTYFSASDGTHGTELWRTDGTRTRTELVQDINPGAASSNPKNFVVAGSVAYFTATTQASGTELWVTDGTSIGTRQVADLATGSLSSSATVIGVIGSKVLVIGNDGSDTTQILWSTDGTASGTIALLSGTALAQVGPTRFISTASNQKAYFAGYDANGQEPWVTDGTLAGTHLLSKLSTQPGVYGGSTPSGFVQAGNYIYFMAYPSFAQGGQLYRIRLADDSIETVTTSLHVENNSPVDPPVVAFGNLVLFISNDAGGEQIWRSDGTSTGTFPLLSYNGNAGNSYFPPSFTAVGSRMLFRSNSPTTGPTLYATDGTVAGTISLYSGVPPVLGCAGSYCYFVASNQIYRTDGTPAGTMTVVAPPLSGSYLAFAGDNGGAYFGVSLAPFQYSVLRYDPTANTSVVLASSSVQPPQLFLSAGHLFFSLSNGSSGAEPWVSDGTPAGTTLLADIAPEPTQAGSNPGSFFAFQNQLYFTANDGVFGQPLWHSGGSSTGTHPVAGLTSSLLGSAPQYLFAAGNTLMFFAKDTTNASSYLWRYDPTSQSVTEILAASLPYTCNTSQPSATASLGGVTFFPAYGPGSVQPWRTDGTVSGTTQLAALTPGGYGSGPCSLVTSGGKIFFISLGIGAQAGYWLWASDGTSAGTVPLALVSPTTPPTPAALMAYGGSV